MSKTTGAYQTAEEVILKEMINGVRHNTASLFWVRWNMGCLYLKRYYPEHAQRLIRSRQFWQWYRHLWHLNDLWIYKHRTHYTMSRYRLYQRERFEQYKPTKPLIRAALRETEEMTV